MAQAKTARIAASTLVNAHTRLVELDLDEPLGFAGGQYIIVDSGRTLPSGKVCKRAYSILSADQQQTRIALASLHLPPGLGSEYMHTLQIDDVMRFSGPWGQWRARGEGPGPALVLATDTGITAALGLLQSQIFAPIVGATVFVWLRTSANYFLPEPLVRERLPARLRVVRMEALPPVGHPERVPYVCHVVGELRRRIGLARAFLCGDGAVNAAVAADLVSAGMPAESCLSEAFFNGVRKAS